MRRVIILTTIVLLLLAVAGVTAAQEPRSDLPTKAAETTEPEGEETGIERPDKPGGQPPADNKANESAEPTPNRPEKSTKDNTPKSEDTGKDGPDEVGEEPNKNDQAGAPKGKPTDRDKGRPESAGKSGVVRKVAVCHKGKTLTVGAPAEVAHVGHGDTVGACGL